jgi:2,3-dihydroxyphenylpropionate 1,2-dioxygenase
MNPMLICVSHSPIIMIRAKPPADEPGILAFYEECRLAIEDYGPEQVIVFGTDHFAGFHYALMPAFCIGLKAAAVDDVGGFPGALRVPVESALELISMTRDRGFDPAVSWDMRIDHGFSQPLHRLLGGLDRFHTIPIFIGALSPPYLPFARSRLFGAAVGRYARQSGKRTLLIGSGGLSHHPTRYYPMMGAAEPDVHAWQMHGESGGSMTGDVWFSRLRRMHEEGAVMLTDGRRTPADIRLNEEIDLEFLTMVMTGSLGEVDKWKPETIVERAGIGFLEVHTWIAAAAAHEAAGGEAPSQSIYSPTLEYGIGYGMVLATQ